MSTLDVVHETRYAYDARVEKAQHIVHLRPRVTSRQRVEHAVVDIEPQPAYWSRSHDVFGNERDAFALYGPHDDLAVTARSRVVLADAVAGDRNDAEAVGWEDVAARCAYRAGAAFEPACEFVFESPFVPRLAALHTYALPSFPAGRALRTAAEDLMHRIHADFTYDGNATEIHTPLAEVLHQRRGVCQDFAHVMVGALRSLGLPARYVSGYLLTQPPPGSPRLLGADASHAWAAVWCPREGWIDFDPTNAVLPARQSTHVTLAWGRDYGDVMPLRGVIRSGGAHTLRVAVSVVPVG
jgi:transglutaminase-like putative cysteine protease